MGRYGKLSAVAILSFTFALPASALDPTKSITQYVHGVWTIEHGLPENSISSILQTRDGYLWIGTQDGIARFDGVRFTVFNKANTPILENNLVSVLCEGRDGTLWIGTVGGGLYGVNHDQWRRFSVKEGIPNAIIFSLAEDSHGNLWIGTVGAGLYHLANGKLKHYGKEEGLLGEMVFSLTLGSRGNLWIGTNGGLNVLRDGKFTRYNTKEGLTSDKVHSVYEDHQDNLWVGTYSPGGLNKLKDGKLTTYTKKDGLETDSVNFITEDADGNLWLGTPAGLIRMRDESFTSFTEKDGLSHNEVTAVYQDTELNLWIGSLGGLNRLRDGGFTTYTTKEGLSADSVNSVFEDRNHNLWIGTTVGANRLTDAKFATITTKDGLLNDLVTTLHEDRQGNLWIGTDDGLNLLSHGKFSSYTERNGLLGITVFALYEDSPGDLWIGVGRGLNRLRDGKLTGYTTKDGLSPGQVRSITEDNEGNLWIGTFGGLTKMRNGKFSIFTTTEGLLSPIVFALYPDRKRNLWIGTAGGLNRMRNGKLTGFTKKDGLFSDSIGNIMEDNAGNLWMCGGGGIFSVNIQELDDFEQGKMKRFHSTAYGKSDGLKVRGCRWGYQPSSWKTHDGKLWFCSDVGAAVIDPQDIRISKLPPPVIIEDILADNSALWSYPVQAQQAKTKEVIRITPGKQRFEFHYTAPSFAIPERVRFQFMLEGFDRTWIDAGTKRFAEYTNLRPGNYTFRVKACNENGIWNEAGAFAAFYLEPHFYETLWFYGLCALVAMGAAFSSYRLRVRQMQEREKELVAAVEKGTHDLREANKRLQEAEERIRQMAESGPQALENLPVWSKIVAEDVAKVIGADRIAIWRIENQEVAALLPGQGKPPSYQVIQQASSDLAEAQNNILAVKGLSGEIYGALVIEGSNRESWGDPERNLLAGFAHQLGSALEMERMRKRLAEAEIKKAATIQEMNERGIAILAVCPACQRCYDQQQQECEMDGATLVTSRILPYRIVDRYRLVRLLGEGGMGVVFHAEDEKLRRDVSIKIIHQERLNNPIVRIRMKREAQVLAQIQDPAIVAVYDIGDLPDGSAFLVMEFLKGQDLAAILKREGPGTPKQVATVLLQVGHALHSTHSKGVIHRDLKPSNLFVVTSPNGFQVKVLDFGLAKSVMDDVSLTTTGWVVGTPSYMSPEQARNQLVGEESDLFSLAVLTYELLTDKRLFYGDSTIEVMSKILSAKQMSLSAQLPNAPQQLDLLFDSALAKKPDDRPRSVQQWCQEVAELLQQLPASVPGWRL